MVGLLQYNPSNLKKHMRNGYKVICSITPTDVEKCIFAGMVNDTHQEPSIKNKTQK